MPAAQPRDSSVTVLRQQGLQALSVHSFRYLDSSVHPEWVSSAEAPYYGPKAAMQAQANNPNYLKVSFLKLCFCIIFHALLTSPQRFLTPLFLRTQSTSQISQSISQQIVRKQSSHYHPYFLASLTLKAVSRNKYNTQEDVFKELQNIKLPPKVVLSVSISLYFSNSHSPLTHFRHVTKRLHSQKPFS